MYAISKIKIKNFRSISDLTINHPKESCLTICGSNNVGKTNVLRALNLFFHEEFDIDSDIPYHIAWGSRGQGYKSTIEVEFFDEEKNLKCKIKKEFSKPKKKEENLIKCTGEKKEGRSRGKKMTPQEIKKFLDKFWYIFVEASNVNLPNLIMKVVKNEVLSTGLDGLRSRQKKPLEKLQEFTDECRSGLGDIEKEITSHFKDFIKKHDTLKDLKEWAVEIKFPEFENLRQAISEMVTFTLYDANKGELDTKGSGIQRILFLSIIKYLSTKSKYNVIWGIDEPEAFLQPGLQKEVFLTIVDLAKNVDILITTHSHHFIDLNKIDDTILLKAEYEVKEYARKPGEKFFKTNTIIEDLESSEKIMAIKTHMGINNNDGWEIMPYNLLVEGETDKMYILKLMSKLKINNPNIFVSNGVDKMPAYLPFLENYSIELQFKPKIKCIFDRDSAGREKYNQIKESKYKKIDVLKAQVNNCFGDTHNEIEIEDLIYPKVIIDGLNIILEKKGYSKLICEEVLTKRKLPAYKTTNLLKLIGDEIKLKNSDKNPIDSTSLSFKMHLCQTCCKILDNTNIIKLDEEFPKVRSFIKSISKK